MFTIKDLSEGKCAVINDGTLEELWEVLSLAFPNDKAEAHGTHNYYLKYRNGWKAQLKTDLPTQSVKLFLKKYPKVMWVSEFSDFTDKKKKVVFMEKNGFYIAWGNAETIEEAELTTSTFSWYYAKDIEEPKEYTMQEIADALKIDVNDLKIKK
jgi:hypothetical protein